MRRRNSLVLLLILAGCGRQAPKDVVDNEAVAAGAEANAELANAMASLPNGAADPAQLQALIDRAMPLALPNAKDALYRNVRAGTGGSACGEVAQKPAGRAAPAFRPFVVTPDGVAVVGTQARIAYEDPNDFLADAWIRWCASPEELQTLGPQIRHAAKDAPLPAFGNVGAAAPPPEPPVEPARTAAPAKPPPADVGSFFNSVQHKGD
jgi:hypothetical protein